MTQKKKEYFVLGVMSGTSLDGIDMAICHFSNTKGKWCFDIVKSKTIAFTNELYMQLKNAYCSSSAEIAELHSTLGRFIGNSAKDFCNEINIEIDLVSSHGHTVFHAPKKGYTFQIGSGANIAAITGVLTVCDFRSLDVAKAGQGAPLVPIGDKLLFSDFAGCLNLGGFSNVSFDNELGERIAFDICPVNFVLNFYANKLGFEYDSEGKIAESGVIIQDLFQKLNRNSYYAQSAPKSLGQEWVEENVFAIIKPEYKINDILRTFCEHAAIQISDELNKIHGEKVLITGGGCYNNFLMKLITENCYKVLTIPNMELVNMKEALIFAFMGVLRISNEENSLSSVTGATGNSVGGAVYLP